MAEPTAEGRAAPAASVTRQGSIGMGIAIASLIVFLILAVGAFWAINGDAMTVSTSRASMSVKPGETQGHYPASGPGQIGNITDSPAQRTN